MWLVYWRQRRTETFYKTYEDYKGILCALAVVVPSIVRKTKAFLASRDYRRSKKVRKSALEEAKAIKTPRKTKRKGTANKRNRGVER